MPAKKGIWVDNVEHDVFPNSHINVTIQAIADAEYVEVGNRVIKSRTGTESCRGDFPLQGTEKNRVLSASGYGKHRVTVSLLNGRIVVSHQNTVTGKCKTVLDEKI